MLETLPKGLFFNEILFRLDLIDFSSLNQTSKGIKQRIESFISRSEKFKKFFSFLKEGSKSFNTESATSFFRLLKKIPIHHCYKLYDSSSIVCSKEELTEKIKTFFDLNVDKIKENAIYIRSGIIPLTSCLKLVVYFPGLMEYNPKDVGGVSYPQEELKPLFKGEINLKNIKEVPSREISESLRNAEPSYLREIASVGTAVKKSIIFLGDLNDVQTSNTWAFKFYQSEITDVATCKTRTSITIIEKNKRSRIVDFLMNQFVLINECTKDLNNYFPTELQNSTKK